MIDYSKIDIGKKLELYIDQMIADRKYKNHNEVFKTAIKLLVRHDKSVALTTAVQEGIESGINEGFDEKVFRKDLKSKSQ